MSTEAITKMRGALERCERHEVVALTAIYRIDNRLDESELGSDAF